MHTSRIRQSLTLLLLALAAVLLSSCSQSPAQQQAERSSELVYLREANPELMFGAYTYGGVWTGPEPVLQLESALGRRLDIVHWFSGWEADWHAELFAPLESGRLPMISWEPANISVAAIAAGEQDEYIRSWARGAADYGQPVYLRPFPEMNGAWTPWNGDPEAFVAAWRRIVGIFESEGAHNVNWVWSPNVTDEPMIASNRMELYYPGEQYVDVLAIDGYNWGSVRPHTVWQSFEEILNLAYDRVTALGDQPLWVAETASTELGGDKSRWIQEMFAASGQFDRLEAIVWFDENKETDWRMASSGPALASFQNSLPLLGAELAQRD